MARTATLTAIGAVRATFVSDVMRLETTNNTNKGNSKRIDTY